MLALKQAWSHYRLLLVLAVVVVVADQLTKWVISQWLPVGTFWLDPGVPPAYQPVAVVDGFFYLVHVTNEGAAWSLFSGHARLLGLLGIVALVAIARFRKQLELDQQPMQVIFGLICGGITGNVIDRMAYGHVIDFLDFHFGSYRYPTFNLADSAITTGVAAYFLLSFVPRPWLCWLVRFLLFYTSLILATGVAFGFVFLSVGALTHPHLDWSLRLAKGVANGQFMGIIWAFAMSLVACVMQAYNRRRKLPA